MLASFDPAWLQTKHGCEKLLTLVSERVKLMIAGGSGAPGI